MRRPTALQAQGDAAADSSRPKMCGAGEGAVCCTHVGRKMRQKRPGKKPGRAVGRRGKKKPRKQRKTLHVGSSKAI